MDAVTEAWRDGHGRARQWLRGRKREDQTQHKGLTLAGLLASSDRGAAACGGGGRDSKKGEKKGKGKRRNSMLLAPEMLAKKAVAVACGLNENDAGLSVIVADDCTVKAAYETQQQATVDTVLQRAQADHVVSKIESSEQGVSAIVAVKKALVFKEADHLHACPDYLAVGNRVNSIECSYYRPAC